MAHDTPALPMLSRTHGQTASPTTVGKEIANVVARLQRQRRQLAALPIPARSTARSATTTRMSPPIPTSTGRRSRARFVESLGLDWNPYTTQIEPHDGIAELCDAMQAHQHHPASTCAATSGATSRRATSSRRWAGEVGSSTMPHKVNPIDFENAEGNFGIANALFEHFAAKLPISRWQRDLTDSTVLRALGTAFGTCLIGSRPLLKGLGKLSVNPERLAADLDANWEVLAEPSRR
jgi:adenylosuccinate lyase